jgi:hypothetical protein
MSLPVVSLSTVSFSAFASLSLSVPLRVSDSTSLYLLLPLFFCSFSSASPLLTFLTIFSNRLSQSIEARVIVLKIESPKFIPRASGH